MANEKQHDKRLSTAKPKYEEHENKWESKVFNINVL
jgi:hypothetical protein